MLNRFTMVVVSTSLIWMAAQGNAQAQTKKSAHKSRPVDAVGGCVRHERHAAQSADNLAGAINDARKSSSPAKMHAALELAYKTLAEIRSENNEDVNALEQIREHIGKIEAQEAKVKKEQARLDALLRGEGLNVPFAVN